MSAAQEIEWEVFLCETRPGCHAIVCAYAFVRVRSSRIRARTNTNTHSVKFILPTDVVLADKFAADADTKIAKVEEIPDGWMGKCQRGASTSLYFTPTFAPPVINGLPARAHVRMQLFMRTCGLHVS